MEYLNYRTITEGAMSKHTKERKKTIKQSIPEESNGYIAIF